MKGILKNRGFWGIFVLIAMGAVLSGVLQGTIFQFSPTEHLIFSIVFSIIPGLLWLYFFYLQDKYEREPKHFLLAVFVLGMLLCYGLTMPLESIFRDTHQAATSGPIVELLWAILVFGTIQELTKFLVIRYSIYNSKEFNEPADGVIYSIAAGLGFAATYNIVYLNSLDAINMAVVPVRIIEFYLTSAVFAGIMGYYIGKAKFMTGGSEWTMIKGFLIAAVMNGGYHFINAEVQGFEFNVWNSLMVSAAFVFVLYTIMYYLLNRSVESSPFKN